MSDSATNNSSACKCYTNEKAPDLSQVWGFFVPTCGGTCGESDTIRRNACGTRVSWRKEWDLNPRYGITVYRISSPAHSTTLPSFRLFPIRRTGFAYYRKREVLSNLPLQIRTNSKLSLPEQLSGRKRRLRSDGALQHRPCTDEALREPSRCRQRSGSFRARRRACGRRRGRNR